MPNIGDKYTFTYTGNYQTFVAPISGKYKLECWGASGGIGYGNVNPFGLGGYCSGEIELLKDQVLYVYPGEDGVNTITTKAFNGGGKSFATSGHNGGRGGGATDIRTISGAWDLLASLNSRIIVAGGGGGAQPSCGGSNTTAGHGGGLVGTQSKNLAGGYAGSYANGGSQTAGGTAYNTSGQPVIQGSFGSGADSQSCGAGGGGGWYGGGSTYTAGGGGGSSYYGSLANPSTTTGVNSGNGKAVITLLSVSVSYTSTTVLPSLATPISTPLNITGKVAAQNTDSYKIEIFNVQSNKVIYSTDCTGNYNLNANFDIRDNDNFVLGENQLQIRINYNGSVMVSYSYYLYKNDTLYYSYEKYFITKTITLDKQMKALFVAAKYTANNIYPMISADNGITWSVIEFNKIINVTHSNIYKLKIVLSSDGELKSYAILFVPEVV